MKLVVGLRAGHRTVLQLLVCLALAGAALLALGPASATARPAVTLRPASALDGPIRWNVSDYALRCEGRAPRVRIRGAPGWRARVNGGPRRRGSFTARLRGRVGVRSVVVLERDGALRRFHFRCLPRDFPDYEFRRFRPGGPSFVFTQIYRYYAAIFDRNGVPVWWLDAGGVPDNFELLRDGTIAFNPVDDRSLQVGSYEVRSLGGRFIRRIGTAARPADVHELLLLGNGNYMIGRRVVRGGVDTSPYGGSPDSRVIDIEIQEVTPAGRVVWRWNSGDHIGLEETGRWWDEDILNREPYDIVHWNSVAVKGRYMLLSFRHLDAVYKVDRRTGRIVWKLGGTPTARSLEVLGDPLSDFPLGAQHDARFLADGTISIYDNRSALPEPPRVVRYRIDGAAGTARLVGAFGDQDVPYSVCCGSARRVGGSWLVGWGGTPAIGAYDRSGRRLFRLETSIGFTYRANYATSKQLKMRRLRRAMDVVARRGAAR
jgi:hypothetical protein